MGYAVVPNIKDETIVCQKPCEHKDCAANRDEWMFSKCTYCAMPMRAGENFYYDLDEGEKLPESSGERSKFHIHAGCMYERAEKKRKFLI